MPFPRPSWGPHLQVGWRGLRPVASGIPRPPRWWPPQKCRRCRSAGRPRTGFSLIEVVISIAILSIGLVGATRVFPVGLRASQRSELASRATLVAQRTMESLKLSPWNDLAVGSFTDHEERFDVAVTVDQPAVAGVVDATSLKRLTVTVSWVQDTRRQAVTLVTYVYHPV